MRTDRWTDMTKLTVATCNFVNPPKKYKMYNNNIRKGNDLLLSFRIFSQEASKQTLSSFLV